MLWPPSPPVHENAINLPSGESAGPNSSSEKLVSGVIVIGGSAALELCPESEIQIAPPITKTNAVMIAMVLNLGLISGDVPPGVCCRAT